MCVTRITVCSGCQIEERTERKMGCGRGCSSIPQPDLWKQLATLARGQWMSVGGPSMFLGCFRKHVSVASRIVNDVDSFTFTDSAYHFTVPFPLENGQNMILFS
jgi:uncharacterized protein YaeQ